MSKIGKIVLAIFLLLIIGIVSLLKIKNNKKKEFKTAEIHYDTIINKRFLSGKIIASEEIKIKPQISGILKKIYVEVGDKVTVGDKLAIIDIIANPKNLEQAKQQLNRATVNYKNQEIKLLRLKELFKKKLISEFEYNKEQQTLELLKIEVATSKEQLYITKKGFSNKQSVTNIVRATASGTILELPNEVGESVTENNNFNNGSNIAIIANLDALIFESELNENDLKYVKKGVTFNISLNAYEKFKLQGEIINIAAKASVRNGIVMFKMEASITVPKDFKDKIRSGLSATAEIILEKKEHVLAISEKNIVFKNNKAGVYIIADNTEKWKAIELGVSNGLKTEIMGEGIEEKTKIKIIN